MEQLVTTVMMRGKHSRVRLREKMTQGMAQWIHNTNVVLKVKEKEGWRDMITKVVEHSTMPDLYNKTSLSRNQS